MKNMCGSAAGKATPIKPAHGQTLTYVIVIGFGVFLLVVVITVISSVNTDYQEFIAKREIEELCLSINSAVDKIYSESNYAENAVLGEVVVDLPKKIADVSYRVFFSGRNITVEMLDGPKLAHQCATLFNLTYAGETNGGRTRIIFESISGEKTITMARE